LEFKQYNDQEIERKVREICVQGDDHNKSRLVRESHVDPRIPAAVHNNLYELVDYDLNLLIEVLNYSSEREKSTVLRNARDEKGIQALFDEYDRDALRSTEIEDVVQGKDLDIIWEVKKGKNNGEISKAYLTRCLLTIAYHIGFSEEIETFFESEKRKYFALH